MTVMLVICKQHTMSSQIKKICKCPNNTNDKVFFKSNITMHDFRGAITLLMTEPDDKNIFLCVMILRHKCQLLTQKLRFYWLCFHQKCSLRGGKSSKRNAHKRTWSHESWMCQSFKRKKVSVKNYCHKHP